MIHKPTTILLLLVMLQLAVSAQQTYQLDTKKSKMLWNTGKVMGGHSGYILFNSGSLFYSPGGEPLSGVFNIDMKSMRSTDNPVEANNLKTDANLRKEDFFAVNQYPASVINVKKIVRIGKTTTYHVAGELTIKGITNLIEFTANINTKDSTTTITADIDLFRQKWNIDYKPKPDELGSFSGIMEKIVPEIHVSINLILNK